jgi:hypothetical protein
MLSAFEEYGWLVRCMVLPEAIWNIQHNVLTVIRVLLPPDGGNRNFPMRCGFKEL